MQRLYTIRKSIKIGIMEGCRMKDLIEKSAIKKEGKKRGSPSLSKDKP